MGLRMKFVCHCGYDVLVSVVGHRTPFGRMMLWSSGTGSPSRGRVCKMWLSPVILPRSAFM